MPKSKHRKNQKQKSRARTERIKGEQAHAQKKMASVALAVQSVTDSVRKQPPGSTTNSPLQLALREAQLEQYYEPLRLEGIVDPAELSLVSKQDLDRMLIKLERLI